MVCAATPSGSGHSAEAEALVYNFVKRKKPGLLLEMFGKERCQELEKSDHLYDRNTLLSMLEAVKEQAPMVKESGSGGKEQKKSQTFRVTKKDITRISSNNGTIPGRNTIRITPELAVFNYFHERQQGEALEILFNEKTREDYDRKVESMRIWMPPLRRIYAHYRYLGLKEENRLTQEIWRCQLCQKDFKSQGKGLNLLHHIGVHEDVPCPCVIEGCDTTLRMPPSLGSHLMRIHVLPSASMTSQQYPALKEINKQFYKKAEAFRKKYFPPESFIGFDDRKLRNTARDFEDAQCKQCGKISSNEMARRRHVADHLKLSYKCVFEGCDYKAEPNRLSAHFNNKHSTKIGDLNEEQLFKFKQIKVNFGENLRKEVRNYFPYKTEVPEDGIFC